MLGTGTRPCFPSSRPMKGGYTRSIGDTRKISASRSFENVFYEFDVRKQLPEVLRHLAIRDQDIDIVD